MDKKMEYNQITIKKLANYCHLSYSDIKAEFKIINKFEHEYRLKTM
jgi:hypothetical protein